MYGVEGGDEVEAVGLAERGDVEHLEAGVGETERGRFPPGGGNALL